MIGAQVSFEEVCPWTNTKAVFDAESPKRVKASFISPNEFVNLIWQTTNLGCNLLYHKLYCYLEFTEDATGWIVILLFSCGPIVENRTSSTRGTAIQTAIMYICSSSILCGGTRDAGTGTARYRSLTWSPSIPSQRASRFLDTSVLWCFGAMQGVWIPVLFLKNNLTGFRKTHKLRGNLGIINGLDHKRFFW